MDKQRLLELAGVQLDENTLQQFKDIAEEEGLEGLWEIADRVMKTKISGDEKAKVLYGLIKWQEGG